MSPEIVSHTYLLSCEELRNISWLFNRSSCTFSLSNPPLQLENLLLDHNGNVKLADFGFSNFFSYDGESLGIYCVSDTIANFHFFLKNLCFWI